MSENTMHNENKNIDFSKPVFIGEVKSPKNVPGRPQGGGNPLYAFYYRNDIDLPERLRYRGKTGATIVFSCQRDDPFEGAQYSDGYKENKDKEVLEYFINSKDPEKEECLHNMLQETMDRWYVERIHPALFNKMKDIFDHERLNKSKLGQLRLRMVQKIDKKLNTNLEKVKLPIGLKKIEKAVSDKLFDKVKE